MKTYAIGDIHGAYKALIQCFERSKFDYKNDCLILYMPLKLYKQKRNMKKSGEPKAKLKKEGKKLIYTIHKHSASHLHWDLRLEMNHVLKSWAVPKEPPKTKGTKR